MIKFKHFVTEEMQQFTKLKHLEHAEDLMIDSGHAGFHHATEALKNVHQKLKGRFNDTKVTTKYDGSPSVVFGHHPKTGKFFVASKSAFNVDPKINHTHADIEKNHGHAPGLVSKLKAALDHLPKITPKKGVYQGDLMYTKDDIHDHDDKYHFTPNTIMYSAPKKSEHGKKITHAHLGVVVHTKYHGDDLQDMHAGFDPDTHNFKDHKDVHLINHEAPEVIHTGENEKKFTHHMKKAEAAFSKMHPDSFNHVTPHAIHLKTYINATVKDGTKPSVSGYRQHLMMHGQKQVASVTTAKAKQAKHDDMMKKLTHLDTHADSFHSTLTIHDHLQKAKDALVHSLAHGAEFEHSVSGKDVGPEGHVAIHKGHPIKLVNRAEFSRLNFLKNRK